MRSTNQKERLQKLKQGAGTFTYLGGAYDTEAVPGVPYVGPDGNQVRAVTYATVEDSEGKKVQIVDPKAKATGDLVWRKAPKFIRTERKSYKIRIPGVKCVAEEVDGKTAYVAKQDANGRTPILFLELEKNKPTYVGDPRIALKLRCLGAFFKEADEGTEPEAKPEHKSKVKA